MQTATYIRIIGMLVTRQHLHYSVTTHKTSRHSTRTTPHWSTQQRTTQWVRSKVQRYSQHKETPSTCFCILSSYCQNVHNDKRNNICFTVVFPAYAGSKISIFNIIWTRICRRSLAQKSLRLFTTLYYIKCSVHLIDISATNNIDNLTCVIIHEMH